MPEVYSEALVDADLELVYSIAKDVERFPDFMPDVESIEMLERQGNRTVTRWVGIVKEFDRRIRWVEEDFWDEDSYTCQFRQLQGDWDRYEGVWTFAKEGTHTRMSLKLAYEYNVPLIGPLIKKILFKKVQANSDRMLAALKQRAEAQAK